MLDENVGKPSIHAKVMDLHSCISPCTACTNWSVKKTWEKHYMWSTLTSPPLQLLTAAHPPALTMWPL